MHMENLNDATFQRANNELLQLLPKEQMDLVFNQDGGGFGDIDYCFLGFVEIYKYLSRVIPKHFTIIDLGCAYNAQCYFFTEHKQYIAVDISDCVKFKTDNCILITKSIDEFVRDDIGKYNLNQTFAICNYVPPWNSMCDNNGKTVREAFPNCFVYYPSGKGLIK